MIIVRFPPSPTGFLHIGNARIAIINWLFAKKNNGKIILRFDDTDLERSTQEFKNQMKIDLQNIGLDFEEEFSQSQRLEIYNSTFAALLEAGFIYPCFETEEELELKRKIKLSKGLPPIYERAEFTEEQKQNKPYYRFKLTAKHIEWKDLIQGEISYEGKDLSDPVILRANGNFMYTFCSVVDDFLMGISHIIRGADHITNTAIQIQIFTALAVVFKKHHNVLFAHLPLFQNKDGKKISKREGGSTIKEILEEGIEKEAIFNVLSKLGLSRYDDNFKTIGELIEEFDLSKFGKSQIMFDATSMLHFNQKFFNATDYNYLKPKLEGVSKEFFEDIKHNIFYLKDIFEWKDIFEGNHTFLNLLTESQIAMLQTVLKIIKESDFNWKQSFIKLKMEFSTTPIKDVLIPLRIALTGKPKGPEIETIFKNLSPKKIEFRMSPSN